MKELLINGDDFGRHELINAAVERAATDGILRSATLMAGGAAFDDAVAVARRTEKLGVGIHLTLVDGRPVLPASEVPSLVREDGAFYADYGAFVRRYFGGEIRLDEVRAELAAQVERVLVTGLTPTHVDSHQHLHVLPGIVEIVLDLAKESGIGAMRVPKAPLFAGHFGGLRQLAGRAGLAYLARAARKKARRAGLVTPDRFAGIVAGEAVTERTMLSIIRATKDGVTEVMIHPGTNNETLARDCGWTHDYEAELAALTSPEVKRAVKENDILLCSYRSAVFE